MGHTNVCGPILTENEKNVQNILNSIEMMLNNKVKIMERENKTETKVWDV